MLRDILGEEYVAHVVSLAAAQDSLEMKWRSRLTTAWNRNTLTAIYSLQDHGKITALNAKEIERELAEVFVGQYFDTVIRAMRSTKRMPKLPKRLSYPKGRMPRSLKELRILWDLWKDKGQAPKRQAAIVKKVKDAYIKKCQKTWQQLERPYEQASNADRMDVIRRMQEASASEFSRSKTIVETETTRYWNQTRKDTYGGSQDVTHFLFVPVRDMATTAWCYDGYHPDSNMRGRGGLVYAKDDPLLDRETPPCHWNCRSEILPLTPLSHKHRMLINNKDRQRRAHKCTPLPAGWNS